MNKIILMGRLTADPELRQTQSGISSCRFTVAVNRRYKNSEGKTEADFISCVAWRQTAEFVDKYFDKGSMISLEGTLQNNNWEKDGVKHYSFVVVVENVEFCGSKGDSPKSGSKNKSQPEADFDLGEFEEILSDSDCPF